MKLMSAGKQVSVLMDGPIAVTVMVQAGANANAEEWAKRLRDCYKACEGVKAPALVIPKLLSAGKLIAAAVVQEETEKLTAAIMPAVGGVTMLTKPDAIQVNGGAGGVNGGGATSKKGPIEIVFGGKGAAGGGGAQSVTSLVANAVPTAGELVKPFAELQMVVEAMVEETPAAKLGGANLSDLITAVMQEKQKKKGKKDDTQEPATGEGQKAPASKGIGLVEMKPALTEEQAATNIAEIMQVANKQLATKKQPEKVTEESAADAPNKHWIEGLKGQSGGEQPAA